MDEIKSNNKIRTCYGIEVVDLTGFDRNSVEVNVLLVHERPLKFDLLVGTDAYQGIWQRSNHTVRCCAIS